MRQIMKKKICSTFVHRKSCLNANQIKSLTHTKWLVSAASIETRMILDVLHFAVKIWIFLCVKTSRWINDGEKYFLPNKSKWKICLKINKWTKPFVVQINSQQWFFYQKSTLLFCSFLKWSYLILINSSRYYFLCKNSTFSIVYSY